MAMNRQRSGIVFTIPSVYDGAQLECRISLPNQRSQHGPASTSWQRRGAIVAHPYAPLGGCHDDPVVGFASREILRSGYVVGTFNFRGTGESEGRTSWTGKPELGDYVSFYGFMLYYLSLLGEVPLATSRTEEGKDDQGEGQGEGSDELRLILGGYSYGSLVASHLPEVDVVRDLFGSASSDDTGTMGTIRQTAHRIYSRTVEEGFGHPLQQGSGTTGLPNVIPKTTVSYLLISPLLPPISLFLTLFTKFSLEVGMETSAQGRQIACPKPADQFIANRTLVIYGNEDAFTSASKVRKWADDIFRASRGRFEAHEVDGASHFWREDSVESQARGLLRDWLS